MNRKQRRSALKILRKAYVMSPARVSIDSILKNTPELSVQDTDQYLKLGADEIIELFAKQAEIDVKSYIDSIKQEVIKAASEALEEIDSLGQGQAD